MQQYTYCFTCCKKYSLPFFVFTFHNTHILYTTWLKSRVIAFTFTSVFFLSIFMTRSNSPLPPLCSVQRKESYLFINKLEAACVSRRVEPSVEYNPEGVQLHGRAETSCHSCGAGHGWTGIDLQEPRSQVPAQHEVGSVEFKASLAGLHQVLCCLQGVDHCLLHAWDHNRLPFWPMTLLLKISPELRAGPHVVPRHRRVATMSRFKVLLDGVIAQVDWTEGDK